MKLARSGPPGNESPLAGTPDGRWFDLSPLVSDIDATLLQGLGRVRQALDDEILAEVKPVRFGPPLARPGKIVCIGVNYREHAHETGVEEPPEPIVFLKTPDTVVGPDDTVLIPRGSAKTDYEVELAVVVGSTARYLDSPDDAADCIFGYAISDDVSERAFQLERGGQWDKGKNCETFNPLGPWILTRDEVPDPQALDLQLRVNGETRQKSNTANMIFGVNHLVWYLSQFMVLRPGDVINSGTPSGVALGRPDQPYLREGDVVEIEITGLGVQRHTFGQA